MRSAFFDTLMVLATEDPRIELVVADLGFGAVEPFADAFPDRFLNVGVAEQNMTGVAVGLALTGSIVFTYSIANFPTLRCLEQVRNDACYHGANVKIVSVGGALGYGPLGFSHHATEDLGVLRAIPGLSIAAPGDPVEAAALTRAVADSEGTAYLRLNRSGEPVVHETPIELPPGRSVTLVEGDDVAILVTGSVLPVAIAASRLLAGAGVATRVVSMPWLAPFDTGTVAAAGRETGLVVTLEEHSITGGLGSAVAEVLAEQELGPLLRLGLPPAFTRTVGSQEYLRSIHGLDPESVAGRVLDRLTGDDAGRYVPAATPR